ncbi:MAG: DUF3047 domain-containing protein [Rhodothermales bacterium]
MANRFRWILFLSVLLPLTTVSSGIREAYAQAPILVDDFEGYEAGVPPYLWKRPHQRSRSLLDLSRELERDDDYFEIVEESGNKRARAYTRNESTQVVRPNGDGYRWNLQTHPRLAWEWKAERLPDGAREDKGGLNDAGAALYVMFASKDWLGRPRSIKYTYSSTLPVGKTAKYGPLRVVVVASGADGFGEWMRMERDVVADYRRLFRRDPPDEPVYIMMWSDSDNTESVAEVFFDNIELLPENE